MTCVRAVDRSGQTTVEYTLLLVLAVGTLLGFWSLIDECRADTPAASNSAMKVGDAQRSIGGALEANDAGRTTNPTGENARGTAIWLIPLGLSIVAIGSIVRSILRVRELESLDRRRGEHAGAVDEFAHQRLFDKRQQILKLIERDLYAMLEGRLQVRQLMSTELATVLDTASMDEVKSIMHRNELRHMLVCDQSGALCGIISNRDFGRTKGKLASDVMVRDPVTVSADSLVSPAATVLIDRRISALPVIEDGKLCGVLTTTDLVMALQCSLQVMLKHSIGGGTRASDPS